MYEEDHLLHTISLSNPRSKLTPKSIVVTVLFIAMIVTILVLSISLLIALFYTPRPSKPRVTIQKAAKLSQQQSTVAMFSPASPLTTNITVYKERLESEMKSVFGMQVIYGEHAFDKFGFLAGTDVDRLADIHSLFSDKSVHFMMANRGGWGCNRLLDSIDYDLIRKNPKIVMGYSDLTGLLNAIFFATGLITFHGPMGVNSFVQQWSGVDYNINSKYMKQVLFDNQLATFKNPQIHNTTVIKGGKARGRLVGGNLSVFVAMLGSKHLPPKSNLNLQWEDVILFLEDVGEDAYRMDRMMTSLETSGILNRVAGMMFGTSNGCTDADPQTVDWVIRDHWKSDRPAFMHFQVGHDGQQFTLPVGALAEMDSDQGTLTLLEHPLQ